MTLLCVLCAAHERQRQAEVGTLCGSCLGGIRRNLADIGRLWLDLDPERGTSLRQHVSGGEVAAPLPLRLDVLSELGPGAPVVADPYGDQHGELPTHVLLDQWARVLLDVGCPGRLPPLTVPALTVWLVTMAGYAADERFPVEDFHAELGARVRLLRRLTGQPAERYWVGVPCPVCDRRALHGDGPIICSRCGHHMSLGEMDAWIREAA